MYLSNFGGGKHSVFSVKRLDNLISKHIGWPGRKLGANQSRVLKALQSEEASKRPPKTDELLYKLMGQIDKHRKTNQSLYEAFWEIAKHARELKVKLRGICANNK